MGAVAVLHRKSPLPEHVSAGVIWLKPAFSDKPVMSNAWTIFGSVAMPPQGCRW